MTSGGPDATVVTGRPARPRGAGLQPRRDRARDRRPRRWRRRCPRRARGHQPLPDAFGQDRADLRGGSGAPRRGHHAVRAGRAVLLQRGQQRGHAVARQRGGHEDLGPLRRGPRRVRVLAGHRRHQHRPELRGRPLGAGPVALVHDHDVGDLEQPRLDRLDLVAHLGRLQDHGRVGSGRHLDLALSRADGLEQDDVEAGRVEHVAATVEVAARPPAWPRDAIDRMNTPSSPA